MIAGFNSYYGTLSNYYHFEIKLLRKLKALLKSSIACVLLVHHLRPKQRTPGVQQEIFHPQRNTGLQWLYYGFYKYTERLFENVFLSTLHVEWKDTGTISVKLFPSISHSRFLHLPLNGLSVARHIIPQHPVAYCTVYLSELAYCVFTWHFKAGPFEHLSCRMWTLPKHFYWFN